MRNQASSWVIKILLGLLIISFGIWGIADMFHGSHDPVVASVGSVDLTKSRVNAEIRDELNRLQPMFRGRLDRAKAEQMGIVGQILQDMVNRTAVAIGTRNLGITVSDPMVARHIRSDRTFYNSQGQFDRAIFVNALSRAGMSEDYYVASLKRELAAAEIGQAISAHVPLPDLLVAPLTKFRAEKRVAKYVPVPLPPADQVAAPTEAEIEAYYKKHRQQFMAPAYRSVTYVDLSPEVVAKTIEIPEDKLRETYRERQADFTTPAKRQVEQVVFQSEAAARKAESALANGASFAEAAKQASGGKQAPVALGWVQQKDLLTQLAGPVFSVKEGGTTAPIKTSLGWHIVHVTGTRAGGVQPFEAVRDQIRHDIAVRQAADAIYETSNKLQDALAGGAPLDEAARSLGLNARHIEAIDAQGQNAAGKPVTDLPKGQFLQTAFATPEGQDSDLTETQGGGFFILHVNKVTPPAVRPLDQVRDKVVASITSQKQAQAAEARAKTIMERVKSGQALAAVATAENLSVSTSEPFTRLTQGSDSALPPALMQDLFSAKVGQAAMAEGKKGYVVAVLTDIQPPSEKERTQTAEDLRNELHESVSSDLFHEFVGALRGRIDIVTHPELLHEQS